MSCAFRSSLTQQRKCSNSDKVRHINCDWVTHAEMSKEPRSKLGKLWWCAAHRTLKNERCVFSAARSGRWSTTLRSRATTSASRRCRAAAPRPLTRYCLSQPSQASHPVPTVRPRTKYCIALLSIRNRTSSGIMSHTGFSVPQHFFVNVEVRLIRCRAVLATVSFWTTSCYFRTSWLVSKTVHRGK